MQGHESGIGRVRDHRGQQLRAGVAGLDLDTSRPQRFRDTAAGAEADLTLVRGATGEHKNAVQVAHGYLSTHVAR